MRDHPRHARHGGYGAALAFALACALWPMPAPAAGPMDAAGGGEVTADLRYRYETVDEGGVAEKAAASTLRTRLGYRTERFGQMSAFLEFENVVTVDADEYDSGTNGRTTFPKVADPEGSEVNQVYLERRPEEGPTARAGRQRITLDNERHVGSVGWRQNEQTFDAVSLVEALPSGTTVTYAYLWNVNGVDRTDAAHDSHLVHLRFARPGAGVLSLYDYLINDNDAPATASQTYGARFTGHMGSGEEHAVVALEYARQGGYAGSGRGDSRYLLGEIGTEGGRVNTTVGYEVLGGDGIDAFQTPLATKHAFNGWADRFLTTPAEGLVDLAFTLSTRVGDGQLTAVWHDFSADSGGADFGTELDLLAVAKVGDGRQLGAKYARYNADAFATDVEKLWLFAQTSF